MTTATATGYPTKEEFDAVKASCEKADAMAFLTRPLLHHNEPGLALENVRLVPGVVIGGKRAIIQRQRGRRIERGRLMKVLDRCFAEQRVELTVRAYNKILTDLGFRLGNYTKKAKRNPT